MAHCVVPASSSRLLKHEKLVVTENITLDGVIDASEGWFAPAGDEEVDQSDLNEALREQRPRGELELDSADLGGSGLRFLVRDERGMIGSRRSFAPQPATR